MKSVCIRDIVIGKGSPVVIQSMTNTDTRDVEATVSQIRLLEEAGCEIVRLAISDREAAESIREIKKQTSIPLVADIHFDYRLACLSMEAGVDALRINPGNLGGRDKAEKVILEAKTRNIPIRVGVNAGSLNPKKYPHPTPENMVKSAEEHLEIMDSLNFNAVKVSLKSSSVKDTIDANRLFRKKYDYPLHLGVTEAGTLESSLVKSAMGIGTLLLEGIGDTIRVSITGSPIKEIDAAKMILRFASLREEGVEIISCPTCGRTSFDIEALVNEVSSKLKDIKNPVKIAVMGCAVNGPGEAKEAFAGIAGRNDGKLLFFKNGETIGSYEREEAIAKLVSAVREKESI